MEHTPKPWKIDGLFIYHEDSNGLRTMICEIDNASPPPTEKEANADLIIAAPDLLKACKDALDAATIKLDTYAASEKKQAEIIAQLVQAIAKATP